MARSKILIVEDDPVIFHLYERLLTIEGFDVEVAQTGNAGLAKIEAGGYALILLDVLLPEIDGLGILEEAKKKNLFAKNGPVIVLSNLDVDSAIKKAMSLGASGYIVKSNIEPKDLLEKVKSYMETGS